jgi:hypothetical protein
MVTEWLSEAPAKVLVERAQKLLVEVNHIDLAVLLALVTEEHAESILKRLPEAMRKSLEASLA